MSIYPTADQIAALIAAPDDGPVVMLNLLRFKPEAVSPNEGVSGQEAYAAYGEKMIAFVDIASEPYVQEIGVHRAAGLESQWLIACRAAVLA